MPIKRGTPFIKKYKNELKAYLLIGFPLVWWGIFFLFALGSAIYFSFSNLTMSIDKIDQFGLNNYQRILDFTKLFDETAKLTFDTQFWTSLGISAIWTVGMMIGNNFMGLALSFMLIKIKKGRKLILALLFWPSLVSAIVSADLTSTVFASDTTGLANQLLNIIGAGPVRWFDPGVTVPPILTLMIMPMLLGFCTKLIIYYTAMLSVPESFYEAAKLDTNSDFRIFLKITLPLITNAVMLNLMLSFIDGFKVLGSMQLVTKGGPENRTLSVMLYIYTMAFGSEGAGGAIRMGRASAYAMVLFVIILALTVIQQLVFRKKEDQDVTGA
jgi:ABC-type sugar transport system permease subunit